MDRELFQPVNLNDALKYKGDHQDAILLAGGTDLAVAIHKGKKSEGNIIDLSKIEELKKIQIQSDKINVGVMATFTDLLNSKIIEDKATVICEAAQAVGSPQIRNKGTIGGNICNASPAADTVPVLVCLNAKVKLKSMVDNKIQSRVMAVEDFIIDNNKTLLKKNEILTNIIFKTPSSDTKMSFQKIGRRNALAIARINGSCLLKMDNNKVDKVSLVIGSATSRPGRFNIVENYLTDKELNDEVLGKAGTLAADYVLKQTGMRSSSTYKLPVIVKFTASLIENTLNKGE